MTNLAEQSAAEQAKPADAAAAPGNLAALRLSDRLRRFVDFVGRSASWLAVPLVVVTCLDVVIRKIAWTGADGNLFSLQFWLKQHVGRMFESTLLQETEWHLHTMLFTLVLGYGMIYNTHVRVDLIRENLAFRKQAWLEFIGLTFFMLPFCATVIYFAVDYAHSSYAVNEISASTVGLTHRWLIKSVLVIGLGVAVLSGIAVWLQVVTVLWGPQGVRFPLMTLEWPEERGSKIEGKERVKLEGSMDSLRAPTEAVRAKTSAILTGD
jgi:TRAP-type mannitol/chloroaromatic compound transport system permease small subunit